MKRRPPLFRLLGLLLLAAVITLWARSFRHADGVALFDGAGHLNGVASDRGTLLLFVSRIPFGREKAWSAETASATREEFQTFDQVLYAKEALKFKFAGAKVCKGDVVAVDAAPPAPAVTWPFSAVTVPDWLVVAVLLVPTARWLRRVWLRGRRGRRGLCRECGYDLRGTAGRCPECGAGAVAATG